MYSIVIIISIVFSVIIISIVFSVIIVFNV